jgi:hypothetical protein
MASSEPSVHVTFVASANLGSYTFSFSSDYTIVPVKDSFSVFIIAIVVTWLGLKKWCWAWMMDDPSDSTNFLDMVSGSVFESGFPTTFYSCRMDYWRFSISTFKGATLSRVASLRG